MRSPTPSSLYRIHASGPAGAVESRPGASQREQLPREDPRPARSFAALLAAAEAVQDRVELHRPAGRLEALHGAVQGTVRDAAGFLARRTPWLGLPLLLRRPGRAHDDDR
jgi:hypothetical protein